MNADVTRLQLRVDKLEDAVPDLKTQVELIKKDLQALPEIAKRLRRAEQALWAAVGALGLLEFALRVLGR